MRLPNPFGLALAALLSLALNAAAQTTVQSNLPGAGFDTPDANSAAPTIKVYSRENVLDVLVTDDNGKPVRGLKRSDFTIEEDGKPQHLAGFYEVDKDAPHATTTPLPPNTYSNARTLPANGPVQIFYFDIPCVASYPPGSEPVADTAAGQIFVRAKKYISDYLRTMPAGTEVVIFAHRCDYGLRLLQGFTTDGGRAAAAVDNLVILSQGTGPKFDPIAAYDQIGNYVAGIHGRKNLIWIGSPPNIMRDGGYSWGNRDMTVVHRLMDTYDRFTQEEIAICPFDPVGVPAPGGLFVGHQPEPLSGNTLRVEDIAKETGGEAIYNTNDFKGGVAKIVNDTTHYYTLSYIPPRTTDDGHYHPIKIAVDRPGLHLNYRGGYNSEQPAPPDAVLKVHMTQNTMGLGALAATQLLFDAKVTPGSATSGQPSAAESAASPNPRKVLALAAKTPVSYDTLFTLQPGQIAFTRSSDGEMYNGAVEFDLIAYDPDGKAIAVGSQTLKLPLATDEYLEFEQAPFQFFLPIDLPPGQVTLRLGVFDTVSNKAGTLEIPLTIPSK